MELQDHGKTEVYIRIIKEVLKKNKTAIVLVPEISLTPQMITRFRKRFGKIVSVLHSKLGNRRRYEEWKKIQGGAARIVVGARSAIFAPLQNIGAIVIDEEDDSSYVSEMTPKYDAKDIARYICKQNDAVFVLGSATPSIENYFKAQNGEITLHKLTKRVNSLEMPDIEVVDLRFEKDLFSRKLIQKLKEVKELGKKSIIFLNKRGYSSVVLCKSCGESLKCKRCNVSLTYHKKDNSLKCHYCGYYEINKRNCNKCNGVLSLVRNWYRASRRRIKKTNSRHKCT